MKLRSNDFGILLRDYNARPELRGASRVARVTELTRVNSNSLLERAAPRQGKERPRRQNTDRRFPRGNQKILIATHEDLGPCGNGVGEDPLIVRVSQ